MTANRPANDPEPRAGQCGRCRFVRAQFGSGSSRFWRCTRSDDDPAFPRYPRLPVDGCSGFEPDDPDD